MIGDGSPIFDQGAQVTESISSFLQHELMSLPVAGTYLISRGEEFRPDLIAYRIYGESSYWWLLMKYNRLTHIRQVVNGLKLIYPRISDVDGVNMDLAARSVTLLVEQPEVPGVADFIADFKIDQSAHMAGYYLILPGDNPVPVPPDIYFLAVEPILLDLSRLMSWNKAKWTSTDKLAYASSEANNFAKVYFAVPAEYFSVINIVNSQSDIAGSWIISDYDLQTKTDGVKKYKIFESPHNNLGKTDWVIRLGWSPTTG